MKSRDQILLEEVYRLVCEDISSERLYHGNKKGDFPPDQRRFAGAIFLTSSLNFAKEFATDGEPEKFPNHAVWEVKLKPSLKIFNAQDNKMVNEMDLKSIIQKLIDSKYIDPVNGTKFSEVPLDYSFNCYDYEKNIEFKTKDRSQSVYFYLWRLKHGSWRIIECEPIISAIKSKSYDGFEITETGAKNVAVFDVSSIQTYKKISDAIGWTSKPRSAMPLVFSASPLNN
jgi:hypothetical protein